MYYLELIDKMQKMKPNMSYKNVVKHVESAPNVILEVWF